MSFLSTRLGMVVDTTADAFLTSDVAGNWEILDDFPGLFTGTTSKITTEIATWGSAQQGQYLSDQTTELLWYWNGTTKIRAYGTGMLDETTVTSPVTVTSVLSSTTTVVTLTTDVPTGGRNVEVKAMLPSISNTTQATTVELIEDSTVIQTIVIPANTVIPAFLYAVLQPSAGSHTYSVAAGVAATSTTTFGATATAPITLTVVEQ